MAKADPNMNSKAARLAANIISDARTLATVDLDVLDKEYEKELRDAVNHMHSVIFLRYESMDRLKKKMIHGCQDTIRATHRPNYNPRSLAEG